MDTRLLGKIKSEAPLTAAETLMLDEALEKSGSSTKLMMGALPAEDLNMAWESRLNARIHASKRTTRRWAAFRWAGAIAVPAAAGALLAVFVWGQMGAEPAKPGPEATATTATHDSSVEAMLVDMTNDYDNQAELGVVVPSDTGRYDWRELGSY